MSNLKFYYSAMGGGKTTSLLQLKYNYEQKGMNVVLIKPATDTKAGDEVSSRIGLHSSVDIMLEKDATIMENMQPLRPWAILVDEAQFLTPAQVDELYEITKTYDIPVVCYGLRCDFQMKGFPGSTRLLEIADEIEELKTICSCGEKATQNLRKENGEPVFAGEQVLIDGSTKETTYEGVCGKCYLRARSKTR